MPQDTIRTFNVSPNISITMKKTDGGFTLLELMVTLLIFAVLMAVAFPSYRNMARNNCITTYNNSLVSGFQLARSEAAKRSTSVSVAAIGGNWGGGVQVWLDNGSGTLANDDNGVIDAGEETIRRIDLSCSTTTITETDAGTTLIVFDSSGGASASGTFEICDDRTGETGSKVTLSRTGRPSSSSDPSDPCP